MSVIDQPRIFIRAVPQTDLVQLTVTFGCEYGPRFTVYLNQEAATDLARELCNSAKAD